MNLKRLVLISAASFSFAVVTLLAPAAHAQSENAKSVHQDKFDGPITKIDPTSFNLTIQKENQLEQTFLLDPKTTVKVDGKDAGFSDLKAGDQVAVVAEGQRAVSVEVSTHQIQPETSSK